MPTLASEAQVRGTEASREEGRDHVKYHWSFRKHRALIIFLIKCWLLKSLLWHLTCSATLSSWQSLHLSRASSFLASWKLQLSWKWVHRGTWWSQREWYLDLETQVSSNAQVLDPHPFFAVVAFSVEIGSCDHHWKGGWATTGWLQE